MNLFYDNEYETVTTTCPQCGTSVEQDYRAFLHAINFEEGFMCHDCKCNYAITTVLIDPRSPTLREAKRETCPSCSGKGSKIDWNKNMVKCEHCNGSGQV